MAGVNTLTEFQALLNECQDLHFQEKRKNVKAIYPQYTKAGDTSAADFRSVSSVGLGQHSYTTELGEFYKDSFQMGYERTTTWNKYTLGCVISEDLLEDMEKNKRIREDKTKFLKNVTSELSDSADWTMEVIPTAFLLNATSTTVTTSWPGAGRDALAFASASHLTIKSPTVTISNSQTGAALSQTVLQEAITMLDNMPDDAGRPQAPVKRVGVLCSRYWKWRLDEILKTQGQVDTANNNVNVLTASGISITPIVNPYISNTSTKFLVIDLDSHMMQNFVASKPRFTSEKDISTGAMIYKSRFRYGIDFLSYRGVVYNAGA